MPPEDLRTLVRRLHDELAAAPALDDAARQDLRALAADLEHLSERPPEAGQGGLPGRLREALERFEASHPALAGTLANLIDALALYGL